MLINNQQALKANFSALDANFNFSSIQSFIQDVDRDIISETIGDDALNYFSGNLTGLTGVPAKVLELLQRAEAYLAILKWSQTAMYRLTDRALYISKATDGSIISDKKLRDLRNYCEETGFNYLDKALALLEANLDAVTSYRDSGVRQNLLQGFIKTAADFSTQRNINNSRITFLSMHSAMLDVQEEYLPEILGLGYYSVFKERFLDEELTIYEQKLLPFIKKAVAFLTISRACKELPIKVTDKGLLVNSYNDTREYDQASAAEQARIDYLSDDLKEKGERKLNELKNYLVANATLYPDYLSPSNEKIDINSQESGTFLF